LVKSDGKLRGKLRLVSAWNADLQIIYL